MREFVMALLATLSVLAGIAGGCVAGAALGGSDWLSVAAALAVILAGVAVSVRIQCASGEW